MGWIGSPSSLPRMIQENETLVKPTEFINVKGNLLATTCNSSELTFHSFESTVPSLFTFHSLVSISSDSPVLYSWACWSDWWHLARHGFPTQTSLQYFPHFSPDYLGRRSQGTHLSGIATESFFQSISSDFEFSNIAPTI